MLISVLARNLVFDLHRAMDSGFNCNLDITRSFHEITNYLFVYKGNQLN